MYSYKDPDAVHYIAYEDLTSDPEIAKAIFKAAASTTKDDLTDLEKEAVKEWLGVDGNGLTDISVSTETKQYVVSCTLSNGDIKQFYIKRPEGLYQLAKAKESTVSGDLSVYVLVGDQGTNLGQIYVYNGTKGETGAKGDQGIQGEKGATGEKGADGTSITGITAVNDAGQWSTDRNYTLVKVTTSKNGPYEFKIPDGTPGDDGIGIKQITANDTTNTDGTTDIIITYTDNTKSTVQLPVIGTNIKSVDVQSLTTDYKTPIVFTMYNGTQKTIYIPRGVKGDTGAKGDAVTLATSTHTDSTSTSLGYSTVKFFAGENTTNSIGSVNVYDGASIVDVKETQLSSGNTQVQFKTTNGSYLPTSIEISKGEKGDTGNSVDGVSYSYDTTGDTIATFSADGVALPSPIHIQRGIQGIGVSDVKKLSNDEDGNGRFAFVLSDSHQTDTLTIPKGDQGIQGEQGYSVGSVESEYTEPVVKDNVVVVDGYTTVSFKLNDEAKTQLSKAVKIYDGKQGVIGEKGNGVNKFVVDDSNLVDEDGNLLENGYSLCTLTFDDYVEFNGESTTEVQFKVYRGTKGETGPGIKEVDVTHVDAEDDGSTGYQFVTMKFSAPIIINGEATDIIQFDVKDGLKGETGAQGEKGVGIESVTQSADLTKMYVNLEDGSTTSISLPSGAAGKDGEDGSSSTIIANQTFDDSGNLSGLTFTINTDGVETTTSDLMTGFYNSKLSIDGSTPMTGQLIGAGNVEESIYINNEVGSGFSVENAADDGIGSRITNSGNGIGEYITNGGTGTGLKIENDTSSTGTALYINGNESASNLLRLAYSPAIYVDFQVKEDGSLLLTSSNGKTVTLLSE